MTTLSEGETQPNAETAASRAHHSIKNDILSCALPPGAPIFEGEIAERLGMSKTPVREALGMLVHERFVEVRPRQGYRVTDVTLADVQEIFQLRLLLEPAAAELAAERAKPEHLQILRASVDAEGTATEDFVERSGTFHTVLADASGNRRLSNSLRHLFEEMQRLQYIGSSAGSPDVDESIEHGELLDALLKGNHHLAREIAQRHVESDRMRVFNSILGSLGAAGKGLASDQVRLSRDIDQR